MSSKTYICLFEASKPYDTNMLTYVVPITIDEIPTHETIQEFNKTCNDMTNELTIYDCFAILNNRLEYIYSDGLELSKTEISHAFDCLVKSDRGIDE